MRSPGRAPEPHQTQSIRETSADSQHPEIVHPPHRRSVRVSAYQAHGGPGQSPISFLVLKFLVQGSEYPTLRNALASHINGSPIKAVGSRLSMLSKSVMPNASALKPPAQSKGFSRSM